MKNIFKGNKYFVCIVIVFLLGSIGYGLFNRSNEDDNSKEVVNIVLPHSEITEGLEEQVEKFNSQNTDVVINFQSYEKDYINVAITEIVNQNKIDIFDYFDRFLIDKEEIQDLSNMNIDFSKIDENALVKYNDVPIGVRYGDGAPKLVVNKDILEEVGISNFDGIKTYDELINIASKIKEKMPGVTPIGISARYIDDFFMMIGTPSAMDSNVYPTFWNYKEGKYTFLEASKTVELYRELYSKGLINDDFSTMDNVDLESDFADEKIAITFSQAYNDKFLVKDTANMNLSVEDMPAFKNSNLNKRYFNPSTRILVVRNFDKTADNLDVVEKNVDRHKAAVKKVYEWLMSEDVKNNIVKNKSDLDKIEIDSNNIFNYTELDPSVFITVDKKSIQNTFIELIKGEDDISTKLIELEEDFNILRTTDDEQIKINTELYKE